MQVAVPGDGPAGGTLNKVTVHVDSGQWRRLGSSSTKSRVRLPRHKLADRAIAAFVSDGDTRGTGPAGFRAARREQLWMWPTPRS